MAHYYNESSHGEGDYGDYGGNGSGSSGYTVTLSQHQTPQYLGTSHNKHGCLNTNQHNNNRPVEATLLKLENSNRIPSKDKFRMMPCKTFIMTGGCPYHERCAFLHDPRIRSALSKPKPMRALKHENNSVKDAFYWPDMKMVEIIQNVDSDRLPTADQTYDIPSSFASADGASNSTDGNGSTSSTGGSACCGSGSDSGGGLGSSIHDRAVYSMWMHFTDFCQQVQYPSHNSSNANSSGSSQMRRGGSGSGGGGGGGESSSADSHQRLQQQAQQQQQQPQWQTQHRPETAKMWNQHLGTPRLPVFVYLAHHAAKTTQAQATQAQSTAAQLQRQSQEKRMQEVIIPSPVCVTAIDAAEGIFSRPSSAHAGSLISSVYDEQQYRQLQSVDPGCSYGHGYYHGEQQQQQSQSQQHHVVGPATAAAVDSHMQHHTQQCQQQQQRQPFSGDGGGVDGVALSFHPGSMYQTPPSTPNHHNNYHNNHLNILSSPSWCPGVHIPSGKM